jgi:uncharacterized protein
VRSADLVDCLWYDSRTSSVSGFMELLPLFPLNMVLFPGMPVQLHIFEPRYRQMVKDCLAENRPFGVVQIITGSAETDPDVRAHQVGCSARITRVERLPDGRFNIDAIGDERFVITSLEYTRPYIQAEVSFLPITMDGSPIERTLYRTLSAIVGQYLKKLEAAGRLNRSLVQLPDSPRDLAYLAASILQITNQQRQTLIETGDLATLLQWLVQRYQIESRILDLMVQEPVSGLSDGPFSVN